MPNTLNQPPLYLRAEILSLTRSPWLRLHCRPVDVPLITFDDVWTTLRIVSLNAFDVLAGQRQLTTTLLLQGSNRPNSGALMRVNGVRVLPIASTRDVEGRFSFYLPPYEKDLFKEHEIDVVALISLPQDQPDPVVYFFLQHELEALENLLALSPGERATFAGRWEIFNRGVPRPTRLDHRSRAFTM